MQIANKVLLTNGQYEDKMQAHIKGLQHYAFSVFLFDADERLLLQQRAFTKYHSGGLWSNTCCSHPMSIDDLAIIKEQAIARVKEEMGVECKLFYDSSFEYKSSCGDLIENEVDYIFYGYASNAPMINMDEVCSFKWDSVTNISESIKNNPESYTEWFKSIVSNNKLAIMADYIKKEYKKGNIARIKI